MRTISLLLFFFLITAQSDEQDLQEKLESIQKTKEQKLQEKKAAQEETKRITRELNERERELNKSKRNLRQLTQRYQQLNIQKNYIYNELQRTLAQQDEQEEAFRQHLIQIYKEGNLPMVTYLLTSNDPGEFFDRLYFSRWLVQLDSAWLNSLKEKERRYSQLRQKYEEMVMTVSQLRVEVEKEKQALEKRVQELEKEKRKQFQKIDIIEESLRELEREEQEIERQLQALSRGKAFSELQFTEKFIYPVKGRLSSKFGWRKIRFPGSRRSVWQFHKGIDFAAPKGTPIVAAASGRVLTAGWQGLLGNAVIIVHGWKDGKQYVTFYGHCDEVLVSEGDFVNQGEVIATVGCTGRCTGNHLHFTLHINGEAVDPLPHLK